MTDTWCEGVLSRLPFLAVCAAAALTRSTLPVWLYIAVIVGANVIAESVAALMHYVGYEHGQAATPAAYQQPLPDLEHSDIVATLYYPGLGASRMQALRYTGGGTPTKDAHIPNAPWLLYRVRPVDPPEYVDARRWWTSWAPAPWLETRVLTTFGRLLQHIRHGHDYVLAWPRTSFAQRDDINTFLEALRVEMAWHRTQSRFVLAGSSRGASTVLGAVTHLTEAERRRVAFVLLEGAFDSVPSVARARYGAWAARLLPWALSWLTR